MSAEANKQLLRNFYADVWHCKTPAYDEYLAPEAAAYRQAIENAKASQPDIHFELGEMIAEGDTIVARWTVGAGVLPGGVTEGISIWHLRDGKILDREAFIQPA